MDVRRMLACAVVTALVACLVQPAFANPTGGSVAAGAATISSSGNALTVHQGTGRAIINWGTFSIGAGETTRFKQPSSSSAVLNRVTSSDPSQLYGSLKSNGQVYLLNPNGILIGPNGQIKTGAFIASTLNLAGGAFMSGGPLTLFGISPASIINLGTIHAASGDVALLAAQVQNAGSIEAPKGSAALGSGSQILYAPNAGDDTITIQAPAPSTAGGAAVDNEGSISAASVLLKAAGSPYALAVNNGGAINATTVMNVGGRVILDGGGGATTDSGTIHADASGTGIGGTVTIKGGQTTFSGTLSARGGANGGDGGSAEISGLNLLFLGAVDLSAAKGKTGTIVLDPATITIDAPTAAAIVSSLNTAVVTETATSSITDNAAISNATTTNTLIFDAPQIAINASISLPSGQMQFQNQSGTTASSSLTSAAGANITSLSTNLAGPFATTTFNGPVATGITIEQFPFNATSITATNSANAITGISFGITPFTNAELVSGAVNVSSSTSMSVSGTVKAGSITLTSGGNLTLSSGGTLTSNGSIVLGALGGTFVNNAGAGALAGTGNERLYTSTLSGFSDGGLNFPQTIVSAYPNDPSSASKVTYLIVPASVSGSPTPVPVMIVQANNASKTYGAQDPAFTDTLYGGSIQDLLTPVQFKVQGVDVNIGAYAIIPFGATSDDRQLTFMNGTLTVNPAQLSIAASNGTKTYGAANPAFSTQVSGLVNGDTSAVITGLVLGTTATSSSGVGKYAIVPSGATASNYTITFTPGTLTIAPATLTISGANVTTTYGAPLPNLAPQVTGLAGGDTLASAIPGLSGTTTALQGSGVGTYPTQAGALTISPNYIPVFVAGTLTITPAVLTIAANNATKTYGDPNPALTTTISGLASGDRPNTVFGTSGGALETGSVSTSVSTGSIVGAYLIVPTGATLNNPNYTLNYVNGTLTVNPALLTFSAGSYESIVGGAVPAFAPVYTGLKNGDTPAVICCVSFTTTATTTSPAGTYAVLPSSVTNFNPNYSLVPGPNGTLTIINAQTTGCSLITATACNFQSTLTNKSTTTTNSTTNLSNTTVAKPVFDMNPGPGVSVLNNLLGFTDSNAEAEEQTIISEFVAASQGTSNPLTADQVAMQLQDPTTRDAMLASLVPFIDGELTSIINTDQTTWTPQQAAFVAGMESYIHAQQQAAANKATADYEAWLTQQHLAFETSSENLGVAGITLAAVESTNPAIPPNDFLDEASLGMVMTNQQLAAYNGVTSGLSLIAEQQTSMQAAYAQIVLNTFEQGPSNAAADAQLQAEINSGDPTQVQNAYNELKGEYSGPAISAQAVEQVMSADAGSTADPLGYVGGTISNVGQMLAAVSYVAASTNSATIVKVLGPVGRFMSPYYKALTSSTKEGWYKVLKAATNAKGEALDADETLDLLSEYKAGNVIAKVSDTGEMVLETVSLGGRILSTVGDILSAAGPILEIVGAAIQIGTATAAYSNIATYNNNFNQQIAQLQQPVTVSTLKSMLNPASGPSLMDYVSAMVSTGGAVGP